MKSLAVALLLLDLITLVKSASASIAHPTLTDDYYEELTIVPLEESGNVAAHLSFVTRRHSDITEYDTGIDSTGVGQYDLFPKLIGELVAQYQLTELHLSLTHGRWWSGRWGPQPDAATLGSSGAEVWAVFRPTNITTTDGQVDEAWRNLVHALSGLFCASLTQMVPTMTTSQHFAFRPLGVTAKSNTKMNDKHDGCGGQRGDNSGPCRRYAALASENVCTENLTPWKKLLPCKGSVGLGALLNPIRLYSAQYHTLSLHVESLCPGAVGSGCNNPFWQARQSLSVVFPRTRGTEMDLKSILGSTVPSRCALATSSYVYFDKSWTERACLNLAFTPNDMAVDVTLSNRHLARFDVNAHFDAAEPHTRTGFNVRASVRKRKTDGDCVKRTPVNMAVQVHCYVADSGQQGGQYKCLLDNGSHKRPVPVLYAHIIPWYLRIYYHTLSLRCKGQKTQTQADPWSKAAIQNANYRPSRSRQRPSYMELFFTLPPSSHCELSIDFDKVLLRWTEYPPDAHHGFYAPGPSVFYRTSDHLFNGSHSQHTATHRNADPQPEVLPLFTGSFGRDGVIRVSGESFLINLPTPDFSMPYNVICLVCTVVALAFGPVHNLTTKRMMIKDPEELEKKGLKGKLRALKDKIMAKFHSKRD